MAEYSIEDFSGGMTDHYVNGRPNTNRYMRNLLITRNRKPRSRNGSEAYINTSIPQGNQRISRLYYDDNTIFDDTLFLASGRNVSYVALSNYVPLLGPTGNATYGAGDINNVAHFDEWKNHIITTVDEYSMPRKIYVDEFGVKRVVNIALPELDGSGIDVIPNDPGVNNSYLYAFVYEYTYTVGTVTYTDFSKVYFYPVLVETDKPIGEELPAPDSYVTVSGLPTFTNGITENWDTANINVRIYRTKANQTQYFLLTELDLGSTGYFDSKPDDALGTSLYTNSGIINPDPAPECKYFTVANNIAWYANILSSDGQQYDFRVRHSFQGDLDQSPGDYFVDMEGPVTGISNVDIYPVVFERKKTYRLEGVVDRLGRGAVVRRDISDEVGCISNEGIVRTVRGVYFPALDGFYFCDGFRVQKLSEHLNDRYKKATNTDTQKRRITGGFDRITGRVYWTMMTDEGSTECDSVWVLDPYWGLTNESSFTELYDPASDNIRPTAVSFIDGIMLRADSRGYVFIHNDGLYADPIIDLTETPPNWNTRGVIYDLTTHASSYGSEIVRKWVPRLISVYKNNSSISSLVFSINDDSESQRQLKEFRSRSNIVWDQLDVGWDDPDVVWNFGDLVISKRRFPCGGLRCTYKQIRYTNSKTIIDNSDTLGNGTVDNVAKTVVLDGYSPPEITWPLDIEDYEIYFALDNYTKGYIIDIRSDDQLTVLDPDNSLTNGSQEWIIRGVRKDEIFELESYTIEYFGHGESHPAYSTGGDGANS